MDVTHLNKYMSKLFIHSAIVSILKQTVIIISIFIFEDL